MVSREIPTYLLLTLLRMKTQNERRGRDSLAASDSDGMNPVSRRSRSTESTVSRLTPRWLVNRRLSHETRVSRRCIDSGKRVFRRRTIARVYVRCVERSVLVLCCQTVGRARAVACPRLDRIDRTPRIQAHNRLILSTRSDDHARVLWGREAAAVSRSRRRFGPALQPMRNVAVLKSISVGVQSGVSIVSSTRRLTGQRSPLSQDFSDLGHRRQVTASANGNATGGWSG